MTVVNTSSNTRPIHAQHGLTLFVNNRSLRRGFAARARRSRRRRAVPHLWVVPPAVAGTRLRSSSWSSMPARARPRIHRVEGRFGVPHHGAGGGWLFVGLSRGVRVAFRGRDFRGSPGVHEPQRATRALRGLFRHIGAVRESRRAVGGRAPAVEKRRDEKGRARGRDAATCFIIVSFELKQPSFNRDRRSTHIV